MCSWVTNDDVEAVRSAAHALHGYGCGELAEKLTDLVTKLHNEVWLAGRDS